MQQAPKWLGSEFVNEDDMRRAHAQSLGIPFVLLTREEIAPAALMLIPEPLSRAHSMVAYRTDGDTVEVALLDTANVDKLDFLRADKKIKLRITNQASITEALLLYQKHLKEKFGRALQAGEMQALILHAVLSQASDVHLEVTPAGTRVRYRIQGALHDAMRLRAEAGAALVQSIKVAAKLFPIALIQEGKFKIAPAGDVAGDAAGENVLVSVANVPQVEGERITMRLSKEYAGHQGFTLGALGLHGAGLERVYDILRSRSGLVLVAGKGGSGKTTTLYTLLDQLQAAHASIITIEEVIEHKLPFAIQTHTRPEVGLTMLTGLRAVLRSDPDVVMVGEIDTAEVALLALEAANRGVLVFAALQAKSAAHAIEKMLSFNVPSHLLALNLRGVVGVHLVHTLGEETGVSQSLSREEGALLEGSANFGRVLTALKEDGQVQAPVAWKDVPFFRGQDFAGTIGLQEVLPVTATIKEMILETMDAENIEAAAREEGMGTILEDALFKAAQGLVSLKEVLELAEE